MSLMRSSKNVSEINLLRDRDREDSLSLARPSRVARFSIINRWLMLRLLAPNHERRKDWRGGEFTLPLRSISFRCRVSISIRVLFVSPPPRATRACTKDAFLSMLHQADATGAAARPWGKKGEIARERKRRRNRFIVSLINIHWQMERNFWLRYAFNIFANSTWFNFNEFYFIIL